ncbi:tetratricopeptide repeat protein [Zavarzinella formosa]|uniref:tetratricopeptide repeat protein n=1 Tax=Zavarzinella formosa TaxID=360055 RepID=UPI00030D1243|nr:tetratricopeptide repeat protein [Zavarzinella formosa]
MRRILFMMAALVVAGGQPPRTVGELMREAEVAVGRGELDAAESLYAEAEPLTADPGLVAFNKGVVLFRRGNFRQAELHLRRALADAAIPPERRTKALFNLGDTLVKQAGDTNAKLLQTAIECYELVLRESTDDSLKTDTAHNLELAKLLWAAIISRQPPKDRDREFENPDKPEEKRPPPSPKKEEGKEDAPGGPKTKPDQKEKSEPTKEKVESPKESQETTRKVPGSGNMPVLDDRAAAEPINTEDAEAILKRTAIRLQRERQKLREETSQGERFRPNDW